MSFLVYLKIDLFEYSWRRWKSENRKTSRKERLILLTYAWVSLRSTVTEYQVQNSIGFTQLEIKESLIVRFIRNPVEEQRKLSFHHSLAKSIVGAIFQISCLPGHPVFIQRVSVYIKLRVNLYLFVDVEAIDIG